MIPRVQTAELTIPLWLRSTTMATSVKTLSVTYAPTSRLIRRNVLNPIWTDRSAARRHRR